MSDNWFPTFRRWFENPNWRPNRDAFPSLAKWLELRGPTWRVSTWWPGESLPAKQRSLLHLLRVAHRQRLELAPLVENLAIEHRGLFRRSLRRLAKRLASGTALVDALEQTPDVLDDSSVLAIRFATQSGTLSETYDQLLQVPMFDLTPQQRGLRQLVFYWLIPSIALGSIIFFVMLIIAPTFSKIADEFGMADALIPGPFHFMHHFFQAVSRWWVLWLLAALVLAWLIFGGGPRRFFRRALATRFFRPVAQLRSVELFRLFATAVDAGRPLPGALSTLARYHFDRQLRLKLLYARNEVEQGVDVWTSLADAKLLTPSESQALARASSNEIRSWMLRRLASWKLAVLHRRMATLFSYLHPVIVLLFGSVVLMICLAIFGFLTFLISSLS